MLLSEWVDRYAASNLGLSHLGVEQLRVAGRRLNAWAGHDTCLAELSAELVAGFLRHLLDSGQAPATVNSKRRCLLTLWRSAHEAGLAPPLAVIRPAREPQRVPDSWSLDQVGQLLRHCQTLVGTVGDVPKNDFFASLFLVLYDSGERVGAVMQCRREDFDEARATLRIRAESQKCCRERLCCVSPETVRSLRGLLALSPLRIPIWPWFRTRRHFFRVLRQIIEGAGLPASKGGMGLTHRLRRTSGSLVEAAGGQGHLHLGNSRRVFEVHYLDPRVGGHGQLAFLPRPKV